jgi:CDP-diacylglycerol--inositol 3-phosphatidyltransferase
MPSTTPVWLFVPNLIGYTRVVTGLASLIYAFNDKTFGTFFAFYAFSYILDAVDGVAARALKQTSRFGALLDMVTDRFCTAALLAVLAHHFPSYSAAFLGLMVLDIVSHWAQMYSSMAIGAQSHKNLQDEPALLKFYYTFPYALFTVCLLNEACLLSMFMLKHETAVQAFM